MTGLDQLFSSADMGEFRRMMDAAETSAPIKRTLDPAIYAACFTTEAGALVLADMYARYVHVTRAIPGGGADAAFYREGMAQVVFDIVDQITQAHNGE
jgi:hypothetical protein